MDNPGLSRDVADIEVRFCAPFAKRRIQTHLFKVQ